MYLIESTDRKHDCSARCVHECVCVCVRTRMSEKWRTVINEDCILYISDTFEWTCVGLSLDDLERQQ